MPMFPTQTRDASQTRDAYVRPGNPLRAEVLPVPTTRDFQARCWPAAAKPRAICGGGCSKDPRRRRSASTPEPATKKLAEASEASGSDRSCWFSSFHVATFRSLALESCHLHVFKNLSFPAFNGLAFDISASKLG